MKSALDTKVPKKYVPKTEPLLVTRPKGFYTIIGRLPDGTLKPLLHMRAFDTLEEAESKVQDYARADKAVEFMVLRMVSIVERRS
jgi:hypothetical protein